MIDTSTLPSVPLTAKNTLPQNSAIYFCLDNMGKILYAGSVRQNI